MVGFPHQFPLQPPTKNGALAPKNDEPIHESKRRNLAQVTSMSTEFSSMKHDKARESLLVKPRPVCFFPAALSKIKPESSFPEEDEDDAGDDDDGEDDEDDEDQ